MSNNENASNGYQPRDMTGVLFYDAPGTPTMKGNIQHDGEKIDIIAEPSVDKQQRSYTRITGQGISGALYDNDRKTTDKHPDFSGPIEVNNKKLRMAAWKKQIKNGDNAGSDFLSLALSLPYKKD